MALVSKSTFYITIKQIFTQEARCYKIVPPALYQDRLNTIT